MFKQHPTATGPLAAFNTADAVEHLNQLDVVEAARLVAQVPPARGVRLLELVAATGQPHRGVRITSLQPDGNYRVTEMGPEFVDDPTTLVALELNGEPLSLDHGYPARIIAPGRPGVLQTKWLARIDVLS